MVLFMPKKKVSASIKVFFIVAIISLIVISFLLLPSQNIFTSTTTTLPQTTTTTALLAVNKSLTREVFLDVKSGEGLAFFSNATVEDIRAALAIWEEKINHVINFEEVRGESVADIVIKLSESFNASSEGKKTVGEVFVYLGEVRGIIYILPSAMSCRNQIRAMHEIGHIIGLNHTTAYGSIMYPVESCVQNITSEDATAAIELISQFL
jgi:predicted Zn-dependent protease